MVKVSYSRLVVLLLFFPCCVHAQNFGGNPSRIRWKQVNSPAARVIFPAGMDSQANRINNIVQLLDTTTIHTIGGKRRKWNIILLNQTTIGNAYVRMAPVMSEFYMTPPQNNFSEGSMRWDDNLAIHENRHIQQLSNFNRGIVKLFGFFLGQEGQLLANGVVIPNYFFEGDAVWQETLVSAQGRGRFPRFYNDFKSLWLANKQYSWMKLRSGSYRDYIPDHYRTGYQLTAYGYAVYGEDFWRKVTQDAARFKGVFYPFNKAIERYSGKTYKQFRNDALTFFKAQSFPDSIKDEQFQYITGIEKHNVIDYTFPVYVNDDSILVSKKSYKSLNAFYLIVNGRERKIRVKNSVIDDYFSYSRGKIVYASYQSDPRWANRNYSVLQVLDIHTGKQRQLTRKSKYFSPCINSDATEIIAVHVDPNGTNYLHRLNVNTGALIAQVPNPNNYFFTQVKYIDDITAVSAVRNPGGKIALVKIDLNTGLTENITPFGFNVLGYPFVKGDTIYFSAMNGYADKVFAISLKSRKIYQVAESNNGIYSPVVSNGGSLLFTAFTADGSRLAKMDLVNASWNEISNETFVNVIDPYTPMALKGKNSGLLYSLKEEKIQPVNYKKGLHLFNFHSRRPYIADPEFGYSFFSDNVLSNFSNALTYIYNRNEKSHTIGFSGAYAGWFPVLGLGAEASFNRTFDTAVGKSISFNSSKVNAGISVPLSYVGGRTTKYFTIGGGYNIEQLYYPGIGKNIFTNESLNYANGNLSFSNQSGKARQHVNPRWAQTIAMSYRYAFNFRDSRKFVANSGFYFPGLFTNHSLLLQGSFQERDTLPDIFSNTFSYSRGYTALSTRRMYKMGVNYQFPLLYPEIGVANIVFFQRVRTNAFFDYTNAYARLNGELTDIINRSTGAEVFFDTKLWNSLSFSFGIRYSYLLDTDLRHPDATGRWDLVLFNYIPD